MKQIQLTRGFVATVDDADLDAVASARWYALLTGGGKFIYAARSVRRDDGGRAVCLLHRQLLGAQPGQVVDHVNGDTLNNRRSNLRLCTKAQNCRNNRGRGSASGFKGVSWYPRYGRWVAGICVDYRSVTLGYFDTRELAALAYDAAALLHFGEFACLNFPPPNREQAQR